MKNVAVRILKQGLPVAVVLGLLGWAFAEAAGMVLAGQALVRPAGVDADGVPAAASNDVAGMLRGRLPFTMAAWGFAIVAGMEVLLSLWRGQKPPVENPAKQTQAETDRLLNELLAKAEAEQARQPEPRTPVAN